MITGRWSSPCSVPAACSCLWNAPSRTLSQPSWKAIVYRSNSGMSGNSGLSGIRQPLEQRLEDGRRSKDLVVAEHIVDKPLQLFDAQKDIGQVLAWSINKLAVAHQAVLPGVSLQQPEAALYRPLLLQVGLACDKLEVFLRGSQRLFQQLHVQGAPKRCPDGCLCLGQRLLLQDARRVGRLAHQQPVKDQAANLEAVHLQGFLEDFENLRLQVEAHMAQERCLLVHRGVGLGGRGRRGLEVLERIVRCHAIVKATNLAGKGVELGALDAGAPKVDCGEDGRLGLGARDAAALHELLEKLLALRNIACEYGHAAVHRSGLIVLREMQQ
eukprot:m.268387 g.268387  ORF g.268387 m.268387 type:complete len:327 (+) comp11076_c1_seq1:2399-3379(+)